MTNRGEIDEKEQKMRRNVSNYLFHLKRNLIFYVCLCECVCLCVCVFVCVIENECECVFFVSVCVFAWERNYRSLKCRLTTKIEEIIKLKIFVKEREREGNTVMPIEAFSTLMFLPFNESTILSESNAQPIQ